MNNAFAQLASTFVLTQLQELVSCVVDDEQFFASSKFEKEKKLHSAKLVLGKALSNYLTQVSRQQFISDVKALNHDCLSGEIREKNDLSNAIKDYLLNSFTDVLQEFVEKLDNIDSYYWNSSHSERLVYLKGMKKLTNYEKAWLIKYTYQDLCEAMYQTVRTFSLDTAYVLVQSARPCSPLVKAEIRAKYSDAFVVFAVVHNLFGGMRILVNGKLLDDSWVNKLVNFRTLVPIKM